MSMTHPTYPFQLFPTIPLSGGKGGAVGDTPPFGPCFPNGAAQKERPSVLWSAIQESINRSC